MKGIRMLAGMLLLLLLLPAASALSGTAAVRTAEEWRSEVRTPEALAICLMLDVGRAPDDIELSEVWVLTGPHALCVVAAEEGTVLAMLYAPDTGRCTVRQLGSGVDRLELYARQLQAESGEYTECVLADPGLLDEAADRLET